MPPRLRHALAVICALGRTHAPGTHAPGNIVCGCALRAHQLTIWETTTRPFESVGSVPLWTLFVCLQGVPSTAPPKSKPSVTMQPSATGVGETLVYSVAFALDTRGCLSTQEAKDALRLLFGSTSCA